MLLLIWLFWPSQHLQVGEIKILINLNFTLREHLCTESAFTVDQNEFLYPLDYCQFSKQSYVLVLLESPWRFY